MNPISQALVAAGVSPTRVLEVRGQVVVKLADGGRIAVAEDAEGGWWDFTAYDADGADGADWRTDGSASLEQVAALAG